MQKSLARVALSGTIPYKIRSLSSQTVACISCAQFTGVSNLNLQRLFALIALDYVLLLPASLSNAHLWRCYHCQQFYHYRLLRTSVTVHPQKR